MIQASIGLVLVVLGALAALPMVAAAEADGAAAEADGAAAALAAA